MKRTYNNSFEYRTKKWPLTLNKCMEAFSDILIANDVLCPYGDIYTVGDTNIGAPKNKIQNAFSMFDISLLLPILLSLFPLDKLI